MAKYSDATLTFMKSITENAEQLGDAVSLPEKSASTIKEDINIIELKNLLFRKYGAEWLDWYPEVLSQTLFGANEDNILMNKIQAIKVCLSSDAPWVEWNIFENVGKAFNHQIPNFSIIQPLSLGECLVTGELLTQLREGEQFSGEVLAYVGAVAANENYLYIPIDFQLGKAQKNLDKFTHDHETRDKIAKIWGSIQGKNLLAAEYNEDNLLHQQIGKLAVLNQYVKENSYA